MSAMLLLGPADGLRVVDPAELSLRIHVGERGAGSLRLGLQVGQLHAAAVLGLVELSTLRAEPLDHGRDGLSGDLGSRDDRSGHRRRPSVS